MLSPPAGLILALGRFFEIHVLLICLDMTHTDNTVSDLYSDNYTPTPWPVAYASLSEIRQMLRRERESGDHTLMMIVCQYVDDQQDSFRSDTVWLLPESTLVTDDSLPLRLDSNVVTYADRSNTSVVLREHYAVKGNKLSSVLGTFGEEDGLTVPIPSMWNRRDWGGIEIIGTAETWWPLIGIDEDSLNNITGLYADVIRLLGESLNFTMRIIRSKEKTWGTLNGSEWSGMIGLLNKEQADILVAGLTVTRERSEAVDFSVVLLEDVISLTVARSPVGEGQGADINLMVFLTIFTAQAWLAFLGVALIFGAFYAFTARCPHNTIRHSGNTLYNYVEGVYTFFLTMIQKNNDTGQGYVCTGAKGLFTVLSALSFVMFNYYVGDLTATMTVGGSVSRLGSFQEAIDEEYTIYTSAGTVFEDLFRMADPNSPTGIVYKNHMKTLTVDETVEEFRRLALTVPRIAYFGSSIVWPGDPYLLHLTNFKEALRSQLALGLQKDSELKPAFDYHLIKMVQSGVFRQLKSLWLEKQKPADWSHRIFQDEAISLGYENLFFPSLVMMVGMVGGVVFSLAEYCGAKFGVTERAVDINIRHNIAKMNKKMSHS